MQLEFTREEFAAWLAAKEHNAAGVPMEPCRCPLAEFLHDKFTDTPQGDMIGVAPDHIFHSEIPDSSFEPLPTWAKAFINRLDNKCVKEKQYGFNVSGLDALTILNEVPNE